MRSRDLKTDTSALWMMSAFVLIILAAVGLVAPANAASTEVATRGFGSRCGTFKPEGLPNGAIVTSVTLDQPDPDRPMRCAVHGQIVSSPRSTINWKVDLPDSSVWNSRLLYIGGGGFDGWLPTDERNWEYLAQYLGPDRPRMWTFVVASSDSGHQGKGRFKLADFSWAAENPVALKNHADMANHMVLQVAVALTRGFYGKDPVYRYMYGQSNGGRQGLVSAQRHPEDYDGILSLAPAISQEGFAANQVALQRHLFSLPANWPKPEQIRTFIDAQVTACDGLDGLKDGVIDNYEACHFDPATIVCHGAAQPGQDCLTPGQAESIRLVLSDKAADVSLADGLKGYPAYGPGGDEEEWKTYLLGDSFAARDAADYGLTDNIIKYGITDDPNASLMTHDPADWKAAYLKLSETIDATNPDLDKYIGRRGKIIAWYGAADYCVAMRRLAQYYRMVEARYGEAKTKGFFRFFVSPTLGHGLNGAGANTFGLLSSLQDWVEQGKTPENLTATKLDASGKAIFSRPLCEVGTHPQYRGNGNKTAAASFTCAKN